MITSISNKRFHTIGNQVHHTLIYTRSVVKVNEDMHTKTDLN
jgi:hypothetical protein